MIPAGELVGPAYGASFLLGKTEDAWGETPIEEDNWVAGAEWADQNGAQVISSSLGYLAWYTPEVLDGDTALITIAADIVASRGIAVCNSAGNEGDTDWHYIVPPSDADSVISVGATDWNNDLAAFSSHGPTQDGRTKPEVCARGVDTYCASFIPIPPPVPTYGWLSGTSLACPLVAGCAALILDAHPEWTPMQVREALMVTADNADAPDNDRGWGRINVLDAIDTPVAVGGPVTGSAAGILRAVPNPFRAATTIHYRLPRASGAGTVEIFDVGGRRVHIATLADDGSSFTWNGRDEQGARRDHGLPRISLAARIQSWSSSKSLRPPRTERSTGIQAPRDRVVVQTS